MHVGCDRRNVQKCLEGKGGREHIQSWLKPRSATDGRKHRAGLFWHFAIAATAVGVVSSLAETLEQGRKQRLGSKRMSGGRVPVAAGLIEGSKNDSLGRVRMAPFSG